jgi:uncharacterized SAM-binding protein YcdF (DUF218 family)
VPPTSRPGGQFRRIVVVLLLVAIGGAAYAFNELGSMLAADEPLRKSDAIFVLAGTAMTRALEGADLWLAGYAPRVVLSREVRDPAFDVLAARNGLRFPDDADVARDAYIALGIPPEAVVVPETRHDSTAAEAITLRELARTHGWRRVTVVTSKYHLRRSGFAFRRELQGTGVEISMRGSRYDDAEPARWWRKRSDIRTVMQEFPKLIAYVAGLGA